MGYNTVAVLYNDHTHLIREDGDVGRRIAKAMQSWHVRDRYPLALNFGSGEICSQEHADYSQVVVVGKNRGRRLCDCDDLDGYALDQLADALRRHGWRVKEPGKETKFPKLQSAGLRGAATVGREQLRGKSSEQP